MSVIMDSSHLHQPGNIHRMRSTIGSNSLHPVDHRGAVQKRTNPRHRSISTSQVDRLTQLIFDQQSFANHSNSLPSPIVTSQWLTPQHSPQPQVFTSEAQLEPFPQWTVPTPPHSDTGTAAVTFDSHDLPVTSGIDSSSFNDFDQSTTSAEMSSLGFLLPSQYGSGAVESEPGSYAMDQNYIPPVRVSQSTTTTGTTVYAPTISSSPALYQSKTMPIPSSGNRRHSQMSNSSNNDPSYGQTYRRPSDSYDSLSSSNYSMAPTQTVPSMSSMSQTQMSSPHLGSSSGAGSSQFHQNTSRSPSLYDSGMYGQALTTAPAATQLYSSSPSLSYPPPFLGSSVNEILAKPLGSDSSIRVLNQRPKPQCWEHGCNGRQFSTFSNLLRHQREKSGSAAKSYCPKCGAEFTRTTARNGHLAHDKCTKQRRPSEDK